MVFDRRDAAARAILRVLFTLSNPLLFFAATPCCAGNSRGRWRNIFLWTWVRADMWNEARFASWKLFNDRQNDRSHLDRVRERGEKGSIVYISDFVPFHANNQLAYDQSRVAYLLNRHSSLLHRKTFYIVIDLREILSAFVMRTAMNRSLLDLIYSIQILSKVN